MLRRNIFDPTLVYRVVLYLRMSSDLQNKRSPQQQKNEILRRLKALGYHWVIVEVFCDEAKSGRRIRNRPEYQRMLRLIRTGQLQVDLILVDTLERLGRMDELPLIRKELLEKHGVLVLTADSYFADPTSPAGKALGVIETVRATSHGDVLAHNVRRGKVDSIKLKHWPGGDPPFGLQLKIVMKITEDREEPDYSILIPNPNTSWIILLLFKTAARTAWGITKLAKFLTEHPDIPNNYKPFHPTTIGYWLGQEIYYGELVWGELATGIVDDRIVREPAPEDDIMRVPNFCEPIVPRELWDEVQQIRSYRRELARLAWEKRNQTNAKKISALAPGMVVNYLLSGLVVCAHCGLRMQIHSTEYTTKSGKVKTYSRYICPGYAAGRCVNGTAIPEPWLRSVVVGTLMDRFFPGA